MEFEYWDSLPTHPSTTSQSQQNESPSDRKRLFVFPHFRVFSIHFAKRKLIFFFFLSFHLFLLVLVELLYGSCSILSMNGNLLERKWRFMCDNNWNQLITVRGQFTACNPSMFWSQWNRNANFFQRCFLTPMWHPVIIQSPLQSTIWKNCSTHDDCRVRGNTLSLSIDHLKLACCCCAALCYFSSHSNILLTSQFPFIAKTTLLASAKKCS